MKIRSRILSLLLVLCMVVPTLVGFTSLEEATQTEARIPEESIETITNINETTSPFELPDIITREEAISNGYVGRLKSKEDNLYSLVFDNGDGTNTLRLYSHPVKYVDSNGDVKDISLSVKAESDGSFKSASHSVITTFNKKLTDGISLSHEDINVKMVPSGIGTSPSAKVSTDNKAVSYAIDSKTAYVYELTYSGFKEDIVVKEYTGQTEYTFTLYTNGLALVKEDGSYYLADDKGNIKATVGDIIVFTADERNNTLGSMTHETVRENYEYTMTIHLDADYLRDEKTLYPIRIDPTVEIVSGGVAGAIQDATLNSNAGSGGTSGSILVGVRNTYGVSRILMRFPTLSLDGVSAGDIVSATISLRDIICQSDQNFTVECRIYDKSAPAWTESAPPTFTAAAPYVGSTILSSFVVTYNGGTGGGNWYSFDIKAAAQAWANGTQDPSKGIIFKAADSFESQTTNKWYKTFSSYNRSSYKPSLKITYNTGIAVSSNSVSVVRGGTHTLQATTGAASVAWTSDNTAVATVDANGVVTGVKAGVANITATITGADGTSASSTCIVYVYIPNSVYYIRNKNSNKVMQVYNGNFQGDTHIVQADKHSSSADTIDMLRQQWKTQYLGEGKYSIRPMNIIDSALWLSNSGLLTYYAGETDSMAEIPADTRWIIEWTSSGYVIKNEAATNGYLQIQNSSTTVGADVIAGADSSTLNCRWALEQILIPNDSSDDSEQLFGILIYDTYKDMAATYTGQDDSAFSVYVAPSEVRSLDDMNLYLVAYPYLDKTFNWFSHNTSVARISNTGTITGVSPGTTIITVRHSSGEMAHFNVVVTEVANGTYSLKNKQTQYYADIENHTLADGTTVNQWRFLGGGTQKWIFTHDGYGYYTIHQENGSQLLCMNVENNSTALNEDIVLSYEGTFYFNDPTLWKISVTPSGAFKLIPKQSESLGYVLATSTSSQTNGTRLIQNVYSNDTNYCDEWYLESPRFYDVALIAVPEEGQDRSSYFGNIVADLQNIGYTSYINNHSVISHGWTKNYLLDFMRHSKITLIVTHGHQFSIEAVDGHLYCEDISELDYSELIVYGACFTAAEEANEDNLVKATVRAGARTAIGFQTRVVESACAAWCEKFFEHFSEYYTDDTKNYDDVCIATDYDLQSHPSYEAEDDEGNYGSLKYYFIEGEKSFPRN